MLVQLPRRGNFVRADLIREVRREDYNDGYTYVEKFLIVVCVDDDGESPYSFQYDVVGVRDASFYTFAEAVNKALTKYDETGMIY